MSKTKFVYPILIALLCVTCGQKKTNIDSQFGSIRNAKGYYYEGDKKFKIFKGGVFLTPPQHLKELQVDLEEDAQDEDEQQGQQQ